MSTPLDTRPASEPTASVPHEARPSGPPRWRRRRPIVAAALVATALVAVGVVAAVVDDGGEAPSTEPPLELTLGSSALASCLPFEVGTLSGMSPAFAATATASADGVATLQVDRWYAGDGPDTVVLRATQGAEALIAGFDVVVGERYLITAADGEVNFCGYSGPATPELTAAFDQAFAG